MSAHPAVCQMNWSPSICSTLMTKRMWSLKTIKTWWQQGVVVISRTFFICIWRAPGFSSPFATEDSNRDGISVYREGEPETRLCFRSFSPHRGCVERCLRLSFKELWASGGYDDLHEELFDGPVHQRKLVKTGTCCVKELKHTEHSD